MSAQPSVRISKHVFARHTPVSAVVGNAVLEVHDMILGIFPGNIAERGNERLPSVSSRVVVPPQLKLRRINWRFHHNQQPALKSGVVIVPDVMNPALHVS